MRHFLMQCDVETQKKLSTSFDTFFQLVQELDAQDQMKPF